MKRTYFSIGCFMFLFSVFIVLYTTNESFDKYESPFISILLICFFVINILYVFPIALDYYNYACLNKTYKEMLYIEETMNFEQRMKVLKLSRNEKINNLFNFFFTKVPKSKLQIENSDKL